ncbi:hypothetical protein D3C81_2140520 [compost metagenome]
MPEYAYNNVYSLARRFDPVFDGVLRHWLNDRLQARDRHQVRRNVELPRQIVFVQGFHDVQVVQQVIHFVVNGNKGMLVIRRVPEHVG